jgi:hypothetical protein
MDSNQQMEGMLEVLIRTRRYELWNKIQELYSIPEPISDAIHRWIACDCKYKPQIPTKDLGARVVLREDTVVSPHHS